MPHQPDTADLARRVMEAAGKATEGPWACDEVRTSCGRAFRIGAGEMLEPGNGACIVYDDYGHGENARAANAAFIALSRTAAPALAQAVLEKDAENGLLAWLETRRNLELDYQHGEGGEDGVWRVFRVTGGRNDREWEQIAVGETPADALRQARTALKDT